MNRSFGAAHCHPDGKFLFSNTTVAPLTKCDCRPSHERATLDINIVRSAPLMLRPARFSVLLDQLYGAAVDPSAWPRFLASLAVGYGATPRVLARRSAGTAAEHGGSDGSPGLSRVDLISLFAQDAGDPGWSLPATGFPEAGQSGSQPFGHRLESLLFAQDGLTVLLALTRGEENEPFSEEDICEWHGLAPHLRRMVTLRMQQVEAQLGTQHAMFVLDALGLGIAIVSRRGTLLFASRVARQIIDRADVLSVIQGRLQAAPAVRGYLAGVVSRIIGEGQSRVARSEVVVLPRGGGKCPVSALVTSLPDEPFPSAEPSAVILLHDPARHARIREQDLASLYTLTAAEGRLLRELARGVSLADYAAGAGIARSTAKSYLQQIFAKTGQSRQADLMREIASDPLLRVASEAEKLAD